MDLLYACLQQQKKWGEGDRNIIPEDKLQVFSLFHRFCASGLLP